MDRSSRSPVLVAGLFVDALLVAWLLLLARKEKNSAAWVLHLDGMAQAGGVLRGFVETPLPKPPRRGVELTLGTTVKKVVTSGFSTREGGLVSVPRLSCLSLRASSYPV